MNTYTITNRSQIKCASLALATVVAVAFAETGLLAQKTDDTTNSNPTSKDIIASVRSGDFDTFARTSWRLYSEHERLSEELLKIFKESQSSNFERCAAAFYLGEIHASNAVDALASNITLSLKRPTNRLTMRPPAIEALIKIGNPSIPAVIRNLADNADTQVRGFSLKVLYCIDGDRDIVQLRLQKAMAAQSDQQNKARLQLALKALGETSFGK